MVCCISANWLMTITLVWITNFELMTTTFAITKRIYNYVVKHILSYTLVLNGRMSEIWHEWNTRISKGEGHSFLNKIYDVILPRYVTYISNSAIAIRSIVLFFKLVVNCLLYTYWSASVKKIIRIRCYRL